jgi:hypothetical protein
VLDHQPNTFHVNKIAKQATKRSVLRHVDNDAMVVNYTLTLLTRSLGIMLSASNTMGNMRTDQRCEEAR